MLTAETALVANTHTWWLCDRLAVLCEVEAIGAAIAAREQQYGSDAELEDMRRRLHVVRLTVLTQLLALLWNTETVH